MRWPAVILALLAFFAEHVGAVFTDNRDSSMGVSDGDYSSRDKPKLNEVLFDVTDYGAVGDGTVDDSAAIQAAVNAARDYIIGSAHLDKGTYATVHIPPKKTFITSPFNLTSHMILKVDGILRAITNTTANFEDRWPKLPPLPSYGDSRDAGFYLQYQSLVFAREATDMKIVGKGTIDGMGQWWWDAFKREPESYQLQAGRPNLIRLWNCTNVEITGVTLLNSPFWTLHPVYSKDLYIHEIKIRAPLYAPNVDGIDPDSCQNVRIIANDISCGDDHVAIKAGVCGVGRSDEENGDAGIGGAGSSIVDSSEQRSLLRSFDPIDCATDPKFQAGEYVSQNILVQRNLLRTGMGIALGSELSGGIENVEISQNLIGYLCLHGHDDPARSCGWGHAMHLKTTLTRGGFLRNITFEGNAVYNTTGVFLLETDYQDSKHMVPPANYPTTDIRNITLKNNDALGEARSVNFHCSPYMTCKDVRAIFNVFVPTLKDKSPGAYQCANVETYVSEMNLPKGLTECFLDSMNRTTQQKFELIDFHKILKVKQQREENGGWQDGTTGR